MVALSTLTLDQKIKVAEAVRTLDDSLFERQKRARSLKSEDKLQIIGGINTLKTELTRLRDRLLLDITTGMPDNEALAIAGKAIADPEDGIFDLRVALQQAREDAQMLEAPNAHGILSDIASLLGHIGKHPREGRPSSRDVTMGAEANAIDTLSTALDVAQLIPNWGYSQAGDAFRQRG